MSSKSRAKAAAGSGKGKAGRRQPIRPKSGSGVPLLPIVVGSILGVLAIALIGLIVYYERPQPGPAAVAGVPCDRLEHSQVHYHAALQIVYNGNVVNLPDDAGIQRDSTGTNVTCYYWLHVHAANKNVIHIESPASDTFTVGQFFDVMNSWSQANGKPAQKLDASHVSTFTIGPDQKVVTYVDLGDGKGPQLHEGDPRAIQLKSHEVVTIEITPPDVKPPPAFDWNSAANSGL
ncbi:MAG: hypothetical protein E6I82_06920 [Chloroflexi bacterium]|nr:MAG: hypothetical protein E6I82_06920 [Chloroflexota bacterium]TMF08249.1 MAG: hypothetical protein E6I41_08580 [Chloroflexota bacterium]